jgi:hypothetical protein
MFDSVQCLFFPPTKRLWAPRDSFTFLEKFNFINLFFFRGIELEKGLVVYSNDMMKE